MALIHLTESFTPTLEERAFASRRAITEADISLLKSERMAESTKKYLEETPSVKLEGKTVWRVPVSKYDWRNANGRIYEKRLWQRVIEQQKEAYMGNTGLADHPDDNEDGKFKETAVVWLNMGLDEASKLVWGECIFVGTHGRLAEDIMEAGGRVGFSSSGFGELSESDKSVVRWDTYLLERLADLVNNPSQGVYGRSGMQVKKESSMQEATETKENETMSIEESRVTPTVKLSKAEIRSFREQAESYLENAKKITNPKGRMEELSEILSYWEEGRMAEVAVDLKEKIEVEIKSAQGEIDKAVTEHVKLKEDFDLDNVEALKEGVKKIATDAQMFNRDLTAWKEIAEGLKDKVEQYKAVLASRPTAEAYKDALDQIKRVKEIATDKETQLLAKIAELQNAGRKQQLLEKKMISELKSISEEKQIALEENKALRSHAKGLQIRLDKIAEAQKTRQTAIQERVESENEIRIHPQGSSGLHNFSQTREVQAYYNDLHRRHGADIVPFREAILARKTVKEAARVYLSALTQFDTRTTTKISEALPPEERRKLIEGQTRTRIASKTSEFEKRLPQGWE